MMPNEFASVGDRIFYKKIMAEKLNFVANIKKTVNYLDLWESHYVAIGEASPDGAKKNVNSIQSINKFN